MAPGLRHDQVSNANCVDIFVYEKNYISWGLAESARCISSRLAWTTLVTSFKKGTSAFEQAQRKAVATIHGLTRSL